MARQINATLAISISGTEGNYTIEAISSTAIKVEPHPFSWTPTPQQRDTIELLLIKPRAVSVTQLTSLGQALYAAVFTPQLTKALGSFEYSVLPDSGGRIRMVIYPPELAVLPWEIMHDGEDYIALRSNFPLVRGPVLDKPSHKTSVRGTLRILYVWAEPNDLTELELEEPAETIRQLISENKRIRFDVLPHATVGKLRSALDKDYHILCFAGHGSASHIYLETDNGYAETMSAAELSRELEGRNDTRLVFLAACKTGGSSSLTQTSFAQCLARKAQIPAIVAMQYDVYDNEANRLAARFFEAVAAFRPVDAALSEARKAVVDEGRMVRDVFAPVMYLQSESSSLFGRARNWLAVLFAAAFVIAAALGTIALSFARQETVQKEHAQATAILEAGMRTRLDIAASARQEYSYGNTDLALALAVAANSSPDSPPGAQQTLADIAFAPGAIRAFDAEEASFGSDGKSIFLSDDRNLLVWDLETKSETRRYELPKTIVDFDINPSSQLALIAFGENNAAMLNLITGELTQSLDNVGSPVRFSPNGKIFVSTAVVETEEGDCPSGERFRSVPVLRDAQSGDVLVQFATKCSVSDVEFSQDGKTIVVGTTDGGARVLDTISGAILGEFYWYLMHGWDGDNLPSDINTQVEISPDGSLIAYSIDGDLPTYANALEDNSIIIWDIKRNKVVSQLVGHDGFIRSSSFSSDGQYLLTSSSDGLILWDVGTQKIVQRLPLLDYTNVADHVSLDHDGRMALSASENGVRLWDLASKNLVKTIDIGFVGTGTLIETMDISPDGRTVLVGGLADVRSDPRTTLVDLTTGDIVHSFDWRQDVSQVAFTPDGRYALEVTLGDGDLSAFPNNGLVSLLSIEDGSTLQSYGQIGPFGMSQDGKIMYAGGYLWDIVTGQKLRPIPYGSWGVFSPDNRFVISSPDGNSVIIWDLTSGNELHRYSMRSEISHVVAIAPDSISALSANDSTLIRWDVASGNELQRYVGHEAKVNVAEFSSDGATILSGAEDGSVRLWDSYTGEELRRERHDLEVTGVGFRPDQMTAVSASRDGVIKVWLMPSSVDRLTNWVLGNRYVRELTCQERQNYNVQPLCEQ